MPDNKFPLGTETTVNALGGKQSATLTRFDLVPPFALARIAQIIKTGADKYGENNWKKIEVRDNINHAICHLYAFLASDTNEDHLGNASCRVLFALELALTDVQKDDPNQIIPTPIPTPVPDSMYDRNGTCLECGATKESHKGLTNKFGTSHPVCINCGGYFSTHEGLASRCTFERLNSLQVASNKLFHWSYVSL